MAQPEHILFETDTEVDHYVVVERRYEGRSARVLFSGARRAAQSGIGLDDDPDLLFDYNQRLLELASGLYPQRVLVVGGGAFTLPMALVAALPDATVDVVELDPGLVSIAEEYFGLRETERLQIHLGDGRQFITDTTQTYDLIILDVFSELSIPRAFLTAEFVALLQDRLTPNGAVAMNIIATSMGRNAGLLKSQVAAYAAVFDRVDIFPAAYGLTAWLPQNLILVAQQQLAQPVDRFVRFAAIAPIEAGVADQYHDPALAEVANYSGQVRGDWDPVRG